MNSKKLTALFIIASIALTLAIPAVAGIANTAEPHTSAPDTRDAKVADALEILKDVVGIPNIAAELFPDLEEFKVVHSLDVLKGIVGMTPPVQVMIEPFHRTTTAAVPQTTVSYTTAPHTTNPVTTSEPPSTTTALCTTALYTTESQTTTAPITTTALYTTGATSSSTPPVDGEPLSNEMVARIKEDWLKDRKLSATPASLAKIQLLHLGTYDGNVVFAIGGYMVSYLREGYPVIVAGYEFVPVCENTKAQIWTNGEISSIENSYSNGKLTKQNVKRIHELWNPLDISWWAIPFTSPGVELLPYDLVLRISSDWRPIVQPPHNQFFAHFGTYNGSVVLMTFPTPAQAGSFDIAAGYRFHRPGGFVHFIAWKDGIFRSISGAYESGWLTEEDVKDAWENWHFLCDGKDFL